MDLKIDHLLHDLIESGGRALCIAARSALVDCTEQHCHTHVAHIGRHRDGCLYRYRNVADVDAQVIGDVIEYLGIPQVHIDEANSDETGVLR